MPFNKISYLGQPELQVPLSGTLAPGEVFILPAGQGVIGTFGSVASQFTGFTLSGQYQVQVGSYTSLQFYDGLLQVWRNVSSGGNEFTPVSSDGTNYRLANLTGCPIGAVITNAGSGLTNGFNTVAVAVSAGGSTWNTIVGGAINATVAITAGGTNYTKPPILVFNPPAGQGSTPYILPTAVCTISGGAINAVTVINQGAGLVAAPTIVVLNEQGDTTGAGGILTVNATLVGSGTLVWMGMATPGTGLTAIPTFTFTPASTIAATAIMNFCVQSYGVTGGGTGFGTNALILGSAAQTAGAPAVVNPNYDKLLVTTRLAQIFDVTTGGVINATGTIVDNGFGMETLPVLFPIAQGGLPTAGATLTVTGGGVNDFFALQPI